MTSDSGTTGGSLRVKALAAAGIAALALAVYGNSLLNGFVYDDTFQVVENPWIKDTGHIGDIFTSSVWAFRGSGSNYYRPLMHLVNMASYHAFGLRPWGFHLTNVVLHAGISVIVLLLAARLLGTRSPFSSLLPALAAAAVFATHPIHTEAVSWIAGLPDLLFTLFYLSSLWLYLESTPGGRIRSPVRYALSVAAFFLATLSKEPALTLPAVLLACDLALLGPAAFRRLGALARRHAPFAGVAVLYLALRMHALEGFAPARDPGGLTLGQALPDLFPLLFRYLGKLVLPIHLNAFYEFHPASSWLAPRVMLSVAGTLGLLAAMVALALRGSRKVLLCLVLTLAPLLPALAIWAIPGSKFGERYLYLPVLGFALLVARAFERARGASRGGAVSAYLVLGLVLALYAASSIQRNAVWRDEYSLWSDTVKKSPGSADVQNNLGAAYGRRGLTDDAIEHYTIALELSPDQPDIHDNLGTAYQEKGWTGRAVEQFRRALQLSPGHVSANVHLGDHYDRQGLVALAIERYGVALESRPGAPDLHIKLGVCYAKEGRMNEAARELGRALSLDPGSVVARNNLGIVYAKMGLLDQAVEQLEQALALLPEGVDTLLNLSRVYAMKGMQEEAERYRRRAQAVQEPGVTAPPPGGPAPQPDAP